MSYVARVGIIVSIGVVLFGAAFFLVSGRYQKMKSYQITVIFDNALGLRRGAKVLMSGVEVGTVADIDLTPENRARLRLDIDRDRRIPADSRFTIATGALLGEKYVEITPGRSRRALAAGAPVDRPEQVEKPFQIERVGLQAARLLLDLQKLTQHLDHILGDPRTQSDISQAVANLTRTTADAQQLVRATQAMVVGNQARVDRMMANLVDASAELRRAVSDARALVNQPQLRTGVTETAAALRSASERLDAVLQDVREVTGDPQVSRNLKTAAENLSVASGHVRDVGEKVSRLLGGGARPRVTINLPRPSFQTGTQLTLESAGSGSGRVRTDLSLYVPTGKAAGLRLGLYDFTENDRLIAQRVQWLDPKTAMRYGIFAGRIGGGMDYEASKRLNFSADLYNPKFPRLDLRARYYYSRDLAVLGGVDGLLRQPRAVVGIQWRR